MPEVLRPSKSLDKLNIFRKKRLTVTEEKKPAVVSSDCCVCDSALKFTPGTTCFRCTVCDTINDLKQPSDDSLRPLSLSEFKKLRENDYELLLKRISIVFSSTRCLNESFPNGRQTSLTESGVDLAAVREMYRLMLEDSTLTQYMLQTTGSLLKRPGKKARKAHEARFILILFENPQLKFRRHEDGLIGENLLRRVLGLVSSHSNEIHQSTVNWFAKLPTSILQERVNLINSFLSHRLAKLSHQKKRYDSCWQVKAAARTMALLFAANRGRLAASEFYNSMTDYIDFDADFIAWKNRRERFSFCQYPFFITLKQKQQILAADALRQQRLKVREAYFASLDSGRAEAAVFELRVRRTHIMEDSLREIPAHENDLKKKLIVRFIGEEGVDAGGLRKEYFLLLCRELFDSNFGLFERDEDSNFCWFSSKSGNTTIVSSFFLLGVVLGLAIYNSAILDVQLPPALFRKLIGQPCGLSDLKVLHPVLGQGLQQLLDFEGDVETTFCRNFIYEGGGKVIPLCPHGDQIPVTNANRRDFVNRYVRYILDESCSRQMFHLSRGFHQVAGGNALSLLRAEEIELLVRGSPEPLNTTDLKSVCAYDGFPAATSDPLSHQSVQWFWSIVERMSASKQRQLLSFVTGSDRIPATGTTDLRFRISLDIHASEARLPVSHTCASQIILPVYGSEDELERKLCYAIAEGHVFSLI